ncbi:MAG: peptide chain release factor 2 [Acidimicrobiales bacterium]
MSEVDSGVADARKRVAAAADYLQVPQARIRVEQLELDAADPSLWDDPSAARSLTTELARLKDDVAVFDRLGGEIDDVETLVELAQDEGDDSLTGEINELLTKIETALSELELRALFSGEHDELDAVCEIHSGAGGTDAQDWANILLRMYLRWAERRGFDVELTEVSAGQEAGITSATFVVKGRYAFGLLQAERGVHRLVRISPFDSNARRHTAFAALHVVPYIEHASSEIEIDEKDLRIDKYRSSGAGGQHVNVTDSAVRLTHLPTGIVVSCQNERSQHQNKDRAMQLLAAKLLDLQRQEREAELDELAGEVREVGWGSQIRSYVLHPYQQVKDLRSGLEIGNVDAVLDGEVDKFMEAYLRWWRSEQSLIQ